METKLEFKKEEVKALRRIADSLERVLALQEVNEEYTILHSPRLDDVLMVEAFIREYDGEFTGKEVWDKVKLHGNLRYSTYCNILEYLSDSNKISIDSEGKIGWIYYPEKVEKDLRDLEGL